MQWFEIFSQPCCTFAHDADTRIAQRSQSGRNTPDQYLHTMAKQTLHSSYLQSGFAYRYQTELPDAACSGSGYRLG